MTVDIAQRVTNHWPKTEAFLSADTGIDYAQAKAAAIVEAKVRIYGTSAAVPAEASIPEVAGLQIADLATIVLIPLGKEHYAIQRHRRQSNREGQTIEEYDLVGLLEDLRRDLEGDCARRADEVEDAVGSSSSPVAVPKVSVSGMMLDPMIRAQARGIP